MATPLHHDQPQRALQNAGINREEHTENSKSYCGRKQGTSPFQRNENLANSPDYRRNVQQLPPRSPQCGQSQPHLRKRWPESSSRYGPLEENLGHCISSRPSNCLHANSSLEECRPSYPDHHHIDGPTESCVQYARSFPKEHCSDHLYAGSTPEGPYCVPINTGVGDVREGERFQELERHATTANSYPLDYKAAILRDVPASHTLKHHQHVDHDNYFACTEESVKQKSQLNNLGNTVSEQQQHVVVDSNEVRYVDTSDNMHTGAEHIEQIESGHVVASFAELSSHEIQAEMNEEGDLMASAQSFKTENNFQQLHRELSQSSSDDSYCHVSKEAVEQEYQSDCHLATSLEHLSTQSATTFLTLVYDYARAGVTFNSSNEQQSDNLCNTETDASLDDKKDIDNHDCGTAHDSQRGNGSQQQDVESPPLFLGFNHFCTRFVCGTSKGFRVYDIDTMKEHFSCIIGGVGFVEPRLNTDLFLLVGGGPKPSFPLNTVVIWDAVKGKSLAQLTHKFPIIAVKSWQKRLVAVLEHEVCVYNFSDARLLFQVQTISNIKGVCALSMDDGPLVLAFPGSKKGEVRVEHIGTNGKVPSRNGFDVSAHDSGLASVALNSTGSLLATASYRGTLVRIFNAKDGTLLQELRRGSDRAEIYSLAFSFSSDWLVVSSDKGTVHIFGLRTLGSKGSDIHGVTSVIRNSGSTLSFLKGVLPKYFRSEWSYAQFKLPEEMKSVVAFGQESQRVCVLGTNGSLYKFSFDSEHGDMKLLECVNFLNSREQNLIKDFLS
ncbi:hypothetical protein L7F22_008956 [Adiantum nelumboides]|nr:hypothetical protein [Adiantum nelumboides]